MYTRNSSGKHDFNQWHVFNNDTFNLFVVKPHTQFQLMATMRCNFSSDKQFSFSNMHSQAKNLNDP